MLYHSRDAFAGYKDDIIMRGCGDCDQRFAKFTLPKISSRHDMDSFVFVLAELGLPFDIKFARYRDLRDPGRWTGHMMHEHAIVVDHSE